LKHLSFIYPIPIGSHGADPLSPLRKGFKTLTLLGGEG
jgi:hypothetical protein